VRQGCILIGSRTTGVVREPVFATLGHRSYALKNATALYERSAPLLP